jgi:hypothetical protein
MIGVNKLSTYFKPSAIGTAVAGLAILFSGCGGSDSPTSAGGLPDSPGSGTGTLKVVAAVEGRDTGPGTFESDFLATVTDQGGQPVSGATVTISGAFGTVTLAEDSQAAGDYLLNTYPGFAGGPYTLNVTRGTDNVTSVRATAPSLHTITSPVANAVVTAGQPVNVAWSRPTAADESRVETLDYTGPWTTGDPGMLTVPGASNPARPDQRFRVKRRTVQSAAGGLPGSQLSVRIRNSVEPVICQ